MHELNELPSDCLGALKQKVPLAQEVCTESGSIERGEEEEGRKEKENVPVSIRSFSVGELFQSPRRKLFNPSGVSYRPPFQISESIGAAIQVVAVPPPSKART